MSGAEAGAPEYVEVAATAPVEAEMKVGAEQQSNAAEQDTAYHRSDGESQPQLKLHEESRDPHQMEEGSDILSREDQIIHHEASPEDEGRVGLAEQAGLTAKAETEVEAMPFSETGANVASISEREATFHPEVASTSWAADDTLRHRIRELELLVTEAQWNAQECNAAELEAKSELATALEYFQKSKEGTLHAEQALAEALTCDPNALSMLPGAHVWVCVTA